MKNNSNNAKILHVVVRNLDNFNAANVAVFSAGAICCFVVVFHSKVTQIFVCPAYI